LVSLFAGLQRTDKKARIKARWDERETKVTKIIARKNFLNHEGKLLINGKLGQLTAAEWLYLYHEIEDDLINGQVKLFAGFASLIRERYPKLTTDSVSDSVAW
jgi:hypothetical protein